MKVSAISCTPIKPQVSFGEKSQFDDVYDEINELPPYDPIAAGELIDDDGVSLVHTEGLKKVSEFADAVNNEVVKSSNVKKPIAAVVSVALAGLIAFATGKVIAQKAAVMGEKLKLNLPEMLDNTLRKFSSGVTKAADKLKMENPVTKSEKVKNIIGKGVTGAVNFGKSLYKKIAYSGIADDATAAVRQTKAFANIGGMAGLASVFPSVVAKDSDGNGVSDILERGQCAYTGAKSKSGQLMEKAGKLSKLVDLLS